MGAQSEKGRPQNHNKPCQATLRRPMDPIQIHPHGCLYQMSLKSSSRPSLMMPRNLTGSLTRLLEATLKVLLSPLMEKRPLSKSLRLEMSKFSKLHNLLKSTLQNSTISAKTGETMKAFHRAERHVKELSFQGEQDKKNQDSMSDLAGKLQAKIKTYKNQIAEAEEIAALNLAKFRKAQADLESNEERAKAAGAALLA